ncbi:hypothetical protein BDA99DRAFT_492263 [Phascolomyces articulosus]|uniref:Uncharacterized protein n=1 Tax=Phascolomyces articulosus TaxID=60185 RepID=A0AAD5KCK3_9FUNG|nr:hypothetical protein BDA99DRAFT_492263 [Phascolomyces articulosus]
MCMLFIIDECVNMYKGGESERVRKKGFPLKKKKKVQGFLFIINISIKNKNQGNCLGSRKNSDQGQRLGSSGENNNGPSATSGNTLGSSTHKGKQNADREAMLAAAEQRRQQAENRGVVKQDGKLSKQLAEQKRQNPLQADNSKDMPERIVWD